jgi:hypothetical protein
MFHFPHDVKIASLSVRHRGGSRDRGRPDVGIAPWGKLLFAEDEITGWWHKGKRM